MGLDFVVTPLGRRSREGRVWRRRPAIESLPIPRDDAPEEESRTCLRSVLFKGRRFMIFFCLFFLLF